MNRLILIILAAIVGMLMMGCGDSSDAPASSDSPAGDTTTQNKVDGAKPDVQAGGPQPGPAPERPPG